MLLVGITGAIGHGKTTFAADLAKYAGSSQQWESSNLISEVANDLRSRESVPTDDHPQALAVWLADLPIILADRLHIATTIQKLHLQSQDIQRQPQRYEKLITYINEERADKRLQKLVITPENKGQFRSLLQWLGGYIAAECGPAWYQELVRRVQMATQIELATVGGLRYPSDATTLQAAGGVVLAIIRPGLGSQDLEDPTERHRHNIIPDTIIYNNGSLDQLRACAKATYRDLHAGNLHAEYQASTY